MPREHLEFDAVGDPTRVLALDPTHIRSELRLPMADGVVPATTCAHEVTLRVQGSGFEVLDGVGYIAA